MLIALYIFAMALLIVGAIALAATLPRSRTLWLAPVVVIPPALWAMIQWRCKITGGYNCGWMSFGGGVTWHFWASLAIICVGFTLLAAFLAWARTSPWRIELRDLLWSARWLAGLWAYVVWVAMPVPIIHYPERGGSCPHIPLVCHDIPALGMGGGFWYVAPFFLATLAGMTRYCRHPLNRPPTAR